MSELYILPDTNILMHFTRPDQLDWTARVGRKDVIILLCGVTMREVDKHGALHPVRRLKDRARNLKAWIRSHIGPAATTTPYPVIVDAREPTAFLQRDLDPDMADDRLIAAALMLQAEGREVVIFSDDTIVHAKLPAFGLKGLWADEADRLKDEPDPLEAENDRLKRRVATFESRQPELAIEWPDGVPLFDTVIFPAHPRDVLSPAQMRAKWMPLPDPGPTPPMPRTTDLAELGKFGPSQEDVLAYNVALEAYFLDYEAYFENAKAFATAQAHVVPLNFVAHNRGTAVATSFRASIQTPPGMQLLDPDDLLGDPPMAPTPPRRPGTFRVDDALALLGHSRTPPRLARIPRFPGTRDNSPYLDREEGVVRLRRDKLQHHHSFAFDPAMARLDLATLGGGGQLEIVITAEELPHPIIQRLGIRARAATLEERLKL